MPPSFFLKIKEFVRVIYLRYVYFPFVASKPESFSAAWDYPRIDSGTSIKSSLQPLIVIYPMNDWHTRKQRPHFLADSFVRHGCRCLWINPHLGREYPGLLDRRPILCQLTEGIFELHIRLPREPVFHARMLTQDESDRIAGAVRWALEKIGAQEIVQLVQLPVWFPPAERIRRTSRASIVYDCHDYISGFPNMAADIVAFEADAMAQADNVVFSSEWLRDRFVGRSEQLDAKSRVIRNAVEPSLSDRSERTAARFDKGLMAAYVGAIESWFDETLIATSARMLPHCRFLLAGRVDKRDALSISSLPNVEFLGEISRARIPALLSESNVGLIPFLVNDLTMAANPLKLYEYFSAGLPVVSTCLPEVVGFGDLVHIANTGEEFARAIALALNETDQSLKMRRIRVAESETWDQRAAAFLDLMH